ncbi:tRNA pseudouridine(38-40) synthase TruA [Collinsella sp. AGMB00827]|uniref:tRNA pseudouridine synthase A n=2 Tax=Collinsella ureilytica TaxID=2869515 RepID=A0ABS7MJ70_9ACTN|nr:tRNA pseudouridine(38-40) synthase TruA [Collinsella urealyticum]
MEAPSADNICAFAESLGVGENALDTDELQATATAVLKLSYNGSAFSGFAEQPGEVRTVAGDLRVALETFLRRPVELTCAGRTDAGVHAVGQYVSFPITCEEQQMSQRRWMRALSALLPADIGAQALYHAALGFSARFDARARTYTYRIATGEVAPTLTRQFTWWHWGELDIAAMELAAAELVGEQDFKSFCKLASAIGRPTHRNVHAVSFAREVQLGEELIAFTITGNAFLHSMVRTIVGTLVQIGEGRHEPSWMREVIDACDRQAAGPTAPAAGLCFMRVSYDEGVLTLCS